MTLVHIILDIFFILLLVLLRFGEFLILFSSFIKVFFRWITLDPIYKVLLYF